MLEHKDEPEFLSFHYIRMQGTVMVMVMMMMMMMKTPQVRFPQVEEGVARTMQLYLQLAPTYLSPPCSIHHLVVAVALKVSRITPVGTEDSPFDLLTCTIAVSLLLQCCRILRYCDVLAAW